MRDQEDDEDEKLFAELQRGAGRASPRRRGKARKEKPFVKVPLWWIEQATKATRTPQAFVAVWLLHQAWKAGSVTFPLPNSKLAERGAERRLKRRALANLEEAGLITVDRRHGKTPIVTLVVL
jgi:hypothetical protein